jgi:hypothetical protein
MQATIPIPIIRILVLSLVYYKVRLSYGQQELIMTSSTLLLAALYPSRYLVPTSAHLDLKWLIRSGTRRTLASNWWGQMEESLKALLQWQGGLMPAAAPGRLAASGCNL